MSRRRIKNELPPNVAQAFAELKSDYNAGRTTRTRKRLVGVSSMGSGADYHVRSEVAYLRMMEQAREFDRNDVVVGQGITRLVDNVLKQGIRLDPKTGDEDLDARLSERWKDWTGKPELCDAAKEHSFAGLARLAMRGMIVDGDTFALPLTSGSVEMIEGHRVRRSRRTQKNVVHGILLNDLRERIEVWITKEDLNPNAPGPIMSDIRRVPMRNGRGERQVLQVYDPRRVSQTRGVTALAPIVDVVGMHDDIQFANLVKAQVASCFAIFHQFAAGEVSTPAGQTGERTEETRGDGSIRTVEGIAPGMNITGAPGETLQGFSPNIPNPEFFPHAMLILTFIAINLNMPVHMLLLDPSKTNFSGWRGAMDLARVGFRELQALLIEKFHQPIYLWKVRQWITEDLDLRAAERRTDVDVFGHRWSPPGWPYMEPLKDANADTTIIRSGLDSRRGVLNRTGKDIDDVDRERVADNERLILSAIEAAGRINKQHADAAVDWRELVGFDAKGRKPMRSAGDTMQDLGRAVRSGVRIAESEARAALGLNSDPPEGKLLRFNDADVLEYHAKYPTLMVDELRERLGYGSMPDGKGQVTPAEYLARVKAENEPSKGQGGSNEGESGEGEEESNAENAEEKEEQE